MQSARGFRPWRGIASRHHPASFRRTAALLFAAASASGTAVTASGQAFSLTDLQTLGGTTSFAHGVNNAGEVVGYSTNETGQNRAFLYSNGTMTPLGTLGGSESFAFAINNVGQVTGYARTANGSEHAFRYEGGTMTDLGTLGGVSSYGFAINDSGQVAGGSTQPGDLLYHAFRSGPSGLVGLGSLGGLLGSSEALGIDADGSVVGWTSVGLVQHAFVYRNGMMTDLGTLGGNYSYAEAIRDGVIVGGAFLPGDAAFRAFVYRDGTMTNLGVLPGLAGSTAYALNATGQIVGKSDNGSNETSRAFLHIGDAMFDLNDLVDPASGWVLRQARGINDTGQIVGFGAFAGAERAFLLTPTGKLWKNPAGGSFLDAGNWFSPGAPGASQSAAFAVPGTYTVTVPAPISSGTLLVTRGNVALDVSGVTYAIDGGIGVSGGAALSVNGAGTLTATAPLRVTAGSRFVVAGADVALPLVDGAGTLQIEAGRLRLTSGGGTSLVKSLLIAGTSGAWVGRFDVSDNAVIVDYDAVSPLSTVRDQLRSGRNDGAWNGTGIVSSQADALALGIGYAEAAALYAAFPASFAGRIVDNTAVLLQPTRYGDANLDQVVNLSDFNALASNFGSVSAVWNTGDFNYDGIVNLSDFNLLAANFGLSAGADGIVDAGDWSALASAVPEPAGAAGLCVAAALAGRRRGRSRTSASESWR